MGNMRKGLESGQTYIFNKPMIYKMVETLAQFDPNYRALEEIVLDSSAMEASSVANFGAIKKEGKFHTNPAYIDALSQSAGFVMNANDRSNLEIEVFVNHGWKSFQLFEELSPQKRYQTHVAMLEKSGKIWNGDILILDGDKVVASFKGIAVSFLLLDHFLKRTLTCALCLAWTLANFVISCKVWHGDSSITYYRPRAWHNLGLRIPKTH